MCVGLLYLKVHYLGAVDISKLFVLIRLGQKATTKKGDGAIMETSVIASGLLLVKVLVQRISLREAVQWLRDEGYSVLRMNQTLHTLLVQVQKGFEQQYVDELNEDGRFEADLFDPGTQKFAFV